MEPVDIVLTKDTFEVLECETRLDILKTLNARRMTITKLADGLNLAKSTVHHHLQRLIWKNILQVCRASARTSGSVITVFHCHL